MTTLRLLTSDEQLADVCHEIVNAHLGESIQFGEGNTPPTKNESDIYFVDISSRNFLKSELLEYDPARTVLFIARQDLLKYADTLLEVRCSVMILPASAMRVEMMMRQCLERKCARPVQDEPAHLDALLQSVLETNVRLQVYDQDRNNFLARSLHDFRTPLTSLEGYSEMLLNENLGEISPTQAAVLGRMQRSIRRLTYLADGLFHISLGRNALPPLNVKVESIETCIEQAIHEVSEALEDKNLQLKVHIVPPSSELSFERSQIEQVLVNLLDNAAKFSPRSGLISIQTYPYFWDRRKEDAPLLDGFADRRQHHRSDTNSFRIDIADSGPGISEEILPHLFGEYQSILVRDDRSGTGLGLAICKLILQRHGGAIWATSTPQGTSFSITLPDNPDPSDDTQWVSNQVRRKSVVGIRKSE